MQFAAGCIGVAGSSSSRMKLLLAGLLLIHVAGQPTHDDYEMYRGAFSAEECETIANLFLEQPPEPDDRTIPLLPNMHDEFRVSRLSRFDDGTLMSRGHLDFIYDRLVALQQDEPPSPLFAIAGLELQRPPNGTSASEWAATARQRLRARIGFNLVHEFNSASQASPHLLTLTLARALALARALTLALSLDWHMLTLTLTLALALSLTLSLALSLTLTLALSLTLSLVLSPTLTLTEPGEPAVRLARRHEAGRRQAAQSEHQRHAIGARRRLRRGRARRGRRRG